MSEETTAPAWQAEAETRKAERAKEKAEQKREHHAFMTACAARGVKFGHVSPFTKKEEEGMRKGAQSGFIGKSVVSMILGGPKPSMNELTKSADLKRPISLVLLAAQGLNGSFAYVEDDARIIVAVTVVGKGTSIDKASGKRLPPDRFCRQRGREIAGRRLLSALDVAEHRMVTNPAVWVLHKASPILNTELPISVHVATCFKRTLEAWNERGHGKGNWAPSGS